MIHLARHETMLLYLVGAFAVMGVLALVAFAIALYGEWQDRNASPADGEAHPKVARRF